MSTRKVMDGRAVGLMVFFGDFLGLLAGISWGVTTVVIRTKLSKTPAAQTAFIQLLTCFFVLLPGAALTGRFKYSMTGIVWASLVFQILMVCVVQHGSSLKIG